MKWSILLRLAGSEKEILYIPLKRPNLGRHGNDFSAVPSADPRVREFFALERKTFPEQRKLERVEGLLPGRITLTPNHHYEHKDRQRYFDEVCKAIHAIHNQGRSSVVFLDPDDGIAGKYPRSVHVCQTEIGRVWKILEPTDSLVIYQHRFRDERWLIKRKAVLEEIVCPAPVRTEPESAGNLCFLVVEAY